MVNHLYRGSASGRHTQSKKLNQWARSQDVPVIAVGDYNFDCDYLWPDPKELGDVRNDGLTRILINSGHGKVEYLHRDEAWEKSVIDGTIQRGDILVTHLKSDGRYRFCPTGSRGCAWGEIGGGWLLRR